MGITLLGLGPGNPDALTLQARDALAQAREIFLRTRAHPTVAALPAHLQVHSYDSLYEELETFDAIYAAIADDVVRRGAEGDILYAVPGHPLYGETTVRLILAQARERAIPTQVIAGLSFVDAACAALALDPLERGLQLVDATDLATQHFPRLDPDQPALVGQLYSRAVASDCKLTLLVLYPADHVVTLVDAAGTPEQKISEVTLEELDRSDAFGLLTSLYIPPMTRPSSMNALAEIVAHLRAPEGCPWDREQTHPSLRGSLLEETYEVLEAIDEDDLPHLREELGDLLLLVFLHGQIASEGGEFTLADVVAEIAAKLVRRHPHVFGSVKVNGTEEVLANWDKIKVAENGGRKKTPRLTPRGLPALAQATKVAGKARTLVHLEEIAARVQKLGRSRNREKALGEILYALAAYAASRDVDAESALRVEATRETKALNRRQAGTGK